MSPPALVQAVCALTNVVAVVLGLRDILAPGTPLLEESRLMLIWGSVKTKKKGIVAAPVEGPMLVLLRG